MPQIHKEKVRRIFPEYMQSITVQFDPEKLPKIPIYAQNWCQAKTEIAPDGKSLKISARSEHLLDLIWQDLHAYAKRHDSQVIMSWNMPVAINVKEPTSVKEEIK